MLMIPGVPPIHSTIRSFCFNVGNLIKNDNRICSGYSVGTDPSGRVAVSATCDGVDGKKYSIRVEVIPVEEGGEL